MIIKKEIKNFEFKDTNKMQNYSTHGIFRYFGKLPPTLVSKILDYSLLGLENRNLEILELMCGSGTTLLESYLRQNRAVGIDINPLSVLVSKVKTTPIDPNILDRLYLDVSKLLLDNDFIKSKSEYYRPNTKNIDYWFSQEIQSKLSCIKYLIDNDNLYNNSNLYYNINLSSSLKALLTVAYASIIRKCSNASPKTGRIFRMNEENTCNPITLFLDKLQSISNAVKSLPTYKFLPEVILADARNTNLEDNRFDFILNHPPYFALYKYSSDVLRFELEWCDFNRKSIAKQEIEDGFKTTNAELLFDYIRDMKDVFFEAKRILKPDAKLCVVVSDSKLRDEQLPVIDLLINAALEVGLTMDEHFIRKVSFAQASYHKSANSNIKTDEDHILYFKK